KPPCTERYARWCERTAVNHRLLLDFYRKVLLLNENSYAENCAAMCESVPDKGCAFCTIKWYKNLHN
ncbi:hypothetical protein, partial [[Clostridium] symbiosum]